MGSRLRLGTPMAYVDGVYIVLISLVAALLSEGISWWLVFRNDDYIALKDKIRRGNKKQRQREANSTLSGSLGGGSSKGQERKQARIDETLRADKQAMQVMRLKATIVAGVLMVGTYLTVTNLFDGLAVGRLPYEPMSWMARLSNRGLEQRGDVREVASIFVYVLCSLSIRGNAQKFFGNAPPKSEALTN